jgi:hypothetical protein
MGQAALLHIGTTSIVFVPEQAVKPKRAAPLRGKKVVQVT